MTSSFAWRRVTNRWPCSRSTFSDPNRVSLQALSQQLPRRLIEAVMPYSARTSRKSSLAYLAAPVAMEDQPCVLARMALEHKAELIHRRAPAPLKKRPRRIAVPDPLSPEQKRWDAVAPTH
jgi:hypothetical protein